MGNQFTRSTNNKVKAVNPPIKSNKVVEKKPTKSLDSLFKEFSTNPRKKIIHSLLDEFIYEYELYDVNERQNLQHIGPKTLIHFVVKNVNELELENYVKALLNIGADVNIPDKYKLTTLLYAIKYKSPRHIVEMILEKDSDINKQDV